MTLLEKMTPKHHAVLYEIAMRAEPFRSNMTLMEFQSVMNAREGFVLTRSGEIIGLVSYSDYVPKIDITIHCFVEPKHQRRWVNRPGLKITYDYPFTELGLPRVSSYSVIGLSDIAGQFLLAMGFKEEGCKRRSYLLEGQYYDVKHYGMLKEECPWI
jgi:RimJ/RimL family protein N-acetyltransferase